MVSNPEDNRRGKRSWVFRIVLVAIALVAWFGSQAAIGQAGLPADGLGDRLFDLLEPVHQYLLDHPAHANALLVVSSAIIDLLGIFLLGTAIFGSSIRPFLGIVVLFALRQICQALIALPAPEGMIWRDPGFPSLLVTYGVANDFFFSGHTSIAVYGAVELARFGKRWLSLLGVAIALFEATTVLVLRAHYTMDVFTGAATAFLAAAIATRLAPKVDRMLEWRRRC